MQHYFGYIKGKEAYIEEKDALRAKQVKRIQFNEQIEIAEGERVYLCRCRRLFPLSFEVIAEITDTREPPLKLNLAFALLKGDHNELIVLKGTELGVSRFLPFVSARTVVLPKGKEDNKLQRLRKIAKEGAEQCRRSLIPEVSAYASFEEIAKNARGLKLFAYEEEAIQGQNILDYAIAGESEATLLIGPEGGFTPEEAALAIDNGFIPVSLGKRILRAETAAIAGAAALLLYSER